ncbi:hypothetical protein CO115_03260 [Candidatus Falkowbacteria bacterium CG_4_9_14_3_um_filter_36_9]|uniref:Uncharacterized protein n=1 Tax=Candidatus Falkowbacteria bacterium CG02_land_8_20_14_3_00_36_14 TaxID=1974560 RepID=A0A2M7DN13_9BACT|nr:MAG: hypothetical protein COS18_03220 [Candidatus Falkowbacteria bacterium CG02_land_8_20_14_3_00_36_14]PIX12177.1 MAG: hypothetical protein COZ73_00780 [Candidatus Falkowbacteria bacterium CG_4_8_14_3_um_filter_36_11]PJA11137.1 MAG: hypothetical protein COX67_01370 [Candidatus Falkowbacteria bacterium CG_4_10_14_0_2_um_filter_36_22]PJB19073.1 MAG: hypothetical protein CO115_03260 [Candidatus Falkowbacteria bacterium CG_4_9_14_3_um_filter_36_9]
MKKGINIKNKSGRKKIIKRKKIKNILVVVNGPNINCFCENKVSKKLRLKGELTIIKYTDIKDFKNKIEKLDFDEIYIFSKKGLSNYLEKYWNAKK